MSDWNSDAGEIHKRLMRNHCPKCDQKLQLIEINNQKVTRFCSTCRLTIQDSREGAEIPPDICD